jgi:hypothetical protein
MRVQDRPRFNYVPVNDPAPGANYAIKNTGVGDWLIVAMAFLFTTSAVVAQRIVEFNVDNGGNPYLRFGNSQGAPAGIAFHYTGFCGSNSIAANGRYTPMDFPMQGVYLPGGWNLKSSIQNLDAGDQLSQLVMQVIELPTGPDVAYMPTPYLIEYQGE